LNFHSQIDADKKDPLHGGFFISVCRQ